MRRGLTIVASLGAVVLLCGASPEKVPEEVEGHMKRMADACKDVGGTPLPDRFTEQVIFADGVGFWAIDEGAFKCDGAASLFSGTAGSEVAIYLSLPNGRAKQVFASYAYGMAIEHLGKFAKLWLSVGGKLCGQKGDPTHADMMSCDRPLRWDANAHKLDFAPMSQAHIPGRMPSAR